MIYLSKFLIATAAFIAPSIVFAQRYSNQIMGLSASTPPPQCVGKGEIDDPTIKMHFVKSDGITFLSIKVLDYENLVRDIGDSCWPVGAWVPFHIHENSFLGVSGLGHDQCDISKTGGHWDPTLACSPQSGNSLCKSIRIPSSSAYSLSGQYRCDPKIYQQKEYACEVGDLSGKYGFLKIPDFHANNKAAITFLAEDHHDTILPCELQRKSIVIHCADSTKRALCAQIFVDGKKPGEIETLLFHASSDIKTYSAYMKQ